MFQANVAGTSAGAIFADGGALSIVNSLFTGNYAVNFAGAIGGGGGGASIVIRNSTFSGNKCGLLGGALEIGIPAWFTIRSSGKITPARSTPLKVRRSS